MTHVEQLLEQWRKYEATSEIYLAVAPKDSPARMIFQSCIQELESAIQRDKEQGK